MAAILDPPIVKNATHWRMGHRKLSITDHWRSLGRYDWVKISSRGDNLHRPTRQRLSALGQCHPARDILYYVPGKGIQKKIIRQNGRRLVYKVCWGH